MNSEVVLQLIVKSNHERALVSLKVAYHQSAADELILSRNALEFVFEAEKNGTLWSSVFRVDSKQFLKRIAPKIRVDMRSFIINEGFSPTQKKQLIKFLQKNLIIEQSQLQLSKPSKLSQFRVLKKPSTGSMGDFSTFISTMRHQKSLLFEAYEDYEQVSHHVRRTTKRGLAYVGKMKKGADIVTEHKHSRILKRKQAHQAQEESDSFTELINSDIQVLTLGDLKYGEIQAAQEFVKEAGAEWLTYYNEIRCVSYRRYYYTVRLHSSVYMIRLELVKVPEGEEIIVSMYQTISKTINYTVIKDKRTQVTFDHPLIKN